MNNSESLFDYKEVVLLDLSRSPLYIRIVKCGHIRLCKFNTVVAVGLGHVGPKSIQVFDSLLYHRRHFCRFTKALVITPKAFVVFILLNITL